MSRYPKKHLGTEDIEGGEELEYSSFPSHILLGENRLPKSVGRLTLSEDELALLRELALELTKHAKGEPFINSDGTFDAEAAWRLLSALRQGEAELPEDER